jgi:hypothetical protein
MLPHDYPVVDYSTDVDMFSSTGDGPSVPLEFLKMLQGQLQVLLNATPKVPFGRDSPYFGKFFLQSFRQSSGSQQQVLSPLSK